MINKVLEETINQIKLRNYEYLSYNLSCSMNKFRKSIFKKIKFFTESLKDELIIIKYLVRVGKLSV